ncbi:hypothetical protein ACE01N_17620 [Saccharicrinis sp. FJH2]|uniref:hypothetical protein n=1 Tax=Saccharicrinis sp. FJH65 TaxID=3344659 RepID=UPI0035F38794
MKKLSVLIFLLLGAYSASSKSPIKFGDVTIEMLEMTHYEKDSTAAAVILCDYGELDGFNFQRTLRIKILSKDGLKWANWTFSTNAKGDIKGKTFNLVNGEIEETKLSRTEDVFKEHIIDDEFRLRVSMPNVKVGSVIDIEYHMNGIPQYWYFQNTIPVVHSELQFYESSYIDFSKSYTGFETLDVLESNRWAMFDVPAFRSEKFMNDPSNYLSKFQFEITSVIIPQLNYRKIYANSWNDIADHLKHSERFGVKLQSENFIKDLADEINQEELTQAEKIKAAVKSIKHVKWDNNKTLYCSAYTLKDQYEKKLANSAEINIMLINLLNELGIKANPVVLSTRDNGMLPIFNPSLDKLNYVVAHVKDEYGDLLLDATDPYLHPYLVPEYCINGKGRLLEMHTNSWIYVGASAIDKSSYIYDLKMDSTGKMDGVVKLQAAGYSARNKKARYHSYNSAEDYVIDVDNRNASFTVKDYDLLGFEDSESATTEKYSIEIENKGNRIGSVLLINPLFEEKIDENPFKLEKRLYPIDFIYPFEKNLLVNIQLPDNAVIQELPKALRLEMPDKSITAFYSVDQKGNTVQVLYQLSVKEPFINQDKYENIKNFYRILVEKHAEKLIINFQDEKKAKVNKQNVLTINS